MAIVRLPSKNHEFKNEAEIRDFLSQFNIAYAQWDLTKAPSELVRKETLALEEKDHVLRCYQQEVDYWLKQRGYLKADVVALSPQIPNLEEMLKPFLKEHQHTEDEVRFIFDGCGTFSIRMPDEDYFDIQVEPGDFITVPAYTWHWFDLGPDRRIKAVRLFQNEQGWVPIYRYEAKTVST